MSMGVKKLVIIEFIKVILYKNLFLKDIEVFNKFMIFNFLWY